MNDECSTIPATAPERNELAALMLASGRFGLGEVLERTGIAPADLDVLRRSEMFLALVDEFRGRLEESDAVERARSHVVEDSPGNAQWLTQLRDGEIVDDPKLLRIRADAAKALFDRQVPKQQEAAGQVTQIVINTQVVERVERAKAALEGVVVRSVEDVDE